MSNAKLPEPVFWFRPRSDGGYEGPLHHSIIEEVRKKSGAWLPFVTTDQAEAYAQKVRRETLESQPAMPADAERLEFILQHTPGNALRHVVGELADTANLDDFRAAIDARRRIEGEL